MKKIFVIGMILSTFLYSTVYENGDDGSVDRWVAQAGATVSNVIDDDTGSKVIKFSDSAYKYYRIGNLATNSDNKIQWDIKTDRGFTAYVYVSTTNGDKLFYYTILNRDYGVTTSGIHHGLGEDTADGEWHTITRDLDAELHESEPSNNVTSIKWFKLRAIDDTFVDNIMGSGSPSPSPTCSVIEDAEDGTTNKWIASGVTVTNEVDADTGSKVIKLSSDAYKYSRIDNLNNSAKKIEWDIKTNRGFTVYVNTSTSNGNRLFYYTILNRDYGVTTSGIHHGLGEDKADGEWHTITRDLEAELHESEPSNNVISINSFKIRAIEDTFIDNIKGCGGEENTRPIADAGPDQTVAEGATVQLDGSGSSDADGGDAITYDWNLTKPAGSTATLSDATIVNPTFVVDVNGTYTATLTVNDGQEDSVGDTITVRVDDSANYGTLTGIVRDTDSNSVLSNVSLTVGNKTVQSNGQGYFTFPNLNPSNVSVLQISKNGFVSVSEIVTIRRGMNSNINIYLRQLGTTYSRDTSEDINITQNGVELHIPANGLVDENGEAYLGTATIYVTAFDPTTNEGRRAFPGEFIGVRADGTTGPLISYGFVDITVIGRNGERLNLAPNINATLIIPIPDSLLGTAPTTTTLWWFNQTNGQWNDDGRLVRNGDSYISQISRFSIWNADYLYQSSFVKGRLIHCDTNLPVRCGEVVVEGNGWESKNRCTNDDGTFDQLPVLFDANANLYGTKNGIRSDNHPFTTASVGQTYDIGDVCLNAPVANITLTWEDQPQDLDAHLTFDNGNGNREMVYYSNKNASDNSAGLDTDDTDGWGPEIITISSWHDGVYRYAVHHYSGSRTISTSGAILNMVIDRNGNGNTSILSLTPPAGAQGSKDVWSAWDILIQDGAVQNITPVNEYLNNINAGNINAFSPIP